ncbi:uncharacterized protein [Phaseolus vulgaris]|uniref:uncharacterized protein n=1 Tax=Phaseolus vulgaris TaxID=3885 RepID=UPI0035CBAF6F
MTVGETGYWDDHGWTWHLNWRRERFCWESDVEEELLTILAREVLVKDAKDFITWSGDSKGLFSVKSAYGLLTNQVSEPSNAAFSLLWRTKAVPKVLTTAWRILLDRIPTYQNLVVFCPTIIQERSRILWCRIVDDWISTYDAGIFVDQGPHYR